jgi:hypothetical protein
MILAMQQLRVLLLRTLWRALLRVRLLGLLERWRCHGSQSADCWFPTDDSGGGYYRPGILRQHCLLFAGHRGYCLAPIDDLGRPVPDGAHFEPEEPEVSR